MNILIMPTFGKSKRLYFYESVYWRLFWDYRILQNSTRPRQESNKCSCVCILYTGAVCIYISGVGVIVYSYGKGLAGTL